MSKSNNHVSLDDALDDLWEKYNRNRRTTDVSTVGELVNELRLKLPKACLESLARRFSYSAGDPLPRLGNLYRTQGYLTHNQACELRKWKTPRKWKTFRDSNSSEIIECFTALASRAIVKYSDAPDFSIWLLSKMEGMGISTASAFLTALNPDEFGIIDMRCWSALHKLTGLKKFDRGKRILFKTDEFHLYTCILRSWSDFEGVSPRLIDKALWQFDKENPITLYEEGLKGITFTDHQYIIRKEGILSREPIIKGTRTPVRAIVENSRLGYRPEKILKGLPHLSLKAIHDALSYYNHHAEEIEEHIERNKVPAHLIHPSMRDL